MMANLDVTVPPPIESLDSPWQDLLPYSGPLIPPPTLEQRRRHFGQLPDQATRPLPSVAPTPMGANAVSAWQADHLIRVHIPQVGSAAIDHCHDILLHRRVAVQVRALFKAWEDARLLDRIDCLCATYLPEIQGPAGNEPSHAWGTAFDLNGRCNKGDAEAALISRLRPLAEIANQLGFYWGGHGRISEPSHFEVAQLIF